MGRPAVTKTIGHVSKEEVAKREDAVKALQEYPELTSDVPEWLDDTAKKEWQRIVPLLKKNSPVSELDTSMIATHCVLYSTIIKCAQDINQSGVVVEEKQSPSFMAMDKAIKDMKSIDSQLGLSPVSRVRLEVHKALNDDTPKDKFEAMLS